MTNAQKKRYDKFMPNGEPKFVRCYDDGESGDPYTVVFSGRYRKKTGGEFIHLGMSARPFHPQGVGMHGSSPVQIDTKDGWTIPIGRKNHLGTRIPFADLPDDCKKLVIRDYLDIWELSEQTITHESGL